MGYVVSHSSLALTLYPHAKLASLPYPLHLTPLFRSGCKLCDLMGSLKGLVQNPPGILYVIRLKQTATAGDGCADG